MVKHYVYRMDHDTGFAPNSSYGVCSLTGCKNSKNGIRKNIEEAAENGSWIVGIGGNGTDNPNKLIYAMEISENLPYSQFKKRYSRKHKNYLKQKKQEIGVTATNVLVSRKFYYFGENAINMPRGLKHLIIDRQGCKCPTDNDINKLKKYLSENYSYGVFGKPNNPPEKENRRKC